MRKKKTMKKIPDKHTVMLDHKCRKLTYRQLEQHRKFLLEYLNIRLLHDYLLHGDIIGAKMIWLCDLEQIIE